MLHLPFYKTVVMASLQFYQLQYSLDSSVFTCERNLCTWGKSSVNYYTKSVSYNLKLVVMCALNHSTTIIYYISNLTR